MADDIFTVEEATAQVCGVSLTIPIPQINLSIPAIPFPPPLPFPIPQFSFSISCNFDNPVDVSAGLEWGGGRTSNALPDPFLEDP